MTEKASTILIVDDELSMRELLEYMLTKEGYQVTCAKSGREAIELLEKDHFDMMLCDIRLGDITGLDVLRAAKKNDSDMHEMIFQKGDNWANLEPRWKNGVFLLRNDEGNWEARSDIILTQNRQIIDQFMVPIED